MADEDVLRTARERFSEARQYDQDNHERAITAIQFKVGEQWPESVAADRSRDKRPMLTINKARKYVRNVVNKQRQNRPGIRVRGVDNDSDPETAKVYEGLIRNIENVSKAEWIYDEGHEQAVDGGFGYWRLTTEYVDDQSFDQHILIKRIRNRFNVALDPHATDFVKRDARWGFITDVVPRDEAEEMYPDITEGWPQSTAREYADWYPGKSVRLAEYFTKEPASKRIALLSNGAVIEVPSTVEGKKVELEDYVQAYIAAQRQRTGEQIEFVRSRVAESHKITWRKLCGHKVLKQSIWPGRYIPIIPVYGDVTNVEGRDHTSGLIEDMMDSQRMYNFWVTHGTEMVALAPKAPFMATPYQIQGHEKMWKQANTKNLPYLLYNHDNKAGIPDRVGYPTTPVGVIQMLQITDQELNDTAGMYEPTFGEPSNEKSGIAIATRQQAGDTSTFHYTDNLNRSIAYTGEQLVDLIPRIYDTQRIIRVLGRDGAEEMIEINTQDEKGNKLYDLSVGRYDVYVEAGPSYATKRQEAAALFMEAIRLSPALLTLLGDLLFKNLDAEGADEAAERMRKIVPPEVMQETGAVDQSGQVDGQRLREFFQGGGFTPPVQ